VATAGARCQSETAGPPPTTTAAATPVAQPGVPGPGSTVPADSQGPSHPVPTKLRRRTCRQSTTEKETTHASD
jgi:hypothetical protein